MNTLPEFVNLLLGQEWSHKLSPSAFKLWLLMLKHADRNGVVQTTDELKKEFNLPTRWGAAITELQTNRALNLLTGFEIPTYELVHYKTMDVLAAKQPPAPVVAPQALAPQSMVGATKALTPAYPSREGVAKWEGAAGERIISEEYYDQNGQRMNPPGTIRTPTGAENGRKIFTGRPVNRTPIAASSVRVPPQRPR